MKTHRFLAVVLLGGLLVGATSCGKPKEQTPPLPAEKKTAGGTNEVSRPIPATKRNAASQAAPAMSAAASNELAQAQSLVEGAKKAFAEGKFADALTALTKLSNLDLTNLPPEQASAFYDQMEALEKIAREAVTKPLTK